MEIILAIVVAFSVVFFGALISTGNERQKKAIDSLRDQILQWSIQDLKLKRERIAREIKMDDPLGWFEKLISKSTGRSPQIQFSGNFNDPYAIVFDSSDFSRRFIFSPIFPVAINRMNRKAREKPAILNRQNPLSTLPRGVLRYELSSLNCGAFFDLELQKAWKILAGEDIGDVERIWMYEIA